MLKRDSLTAQIQQLGDTLAKMKRLIVEEQHIEALSTLKAVLGNYFGTSITELLETPANIFRQHLDQAAFSPEELSLLADYLDAGAEMCEQHADRDRIWEKVLLIYDVLEQEHKVVSFVHIARKAAIIAADGDKNR